MVWANHIVLARSRLARLGVGVRFVLPESTGLQILQLGRGKRVMETGCAHGLGGDGFASAEPEANLVASAWGLGLSCSEGLPDWRRDDASLRGGFGGVFSPEGSAEVSFDNCHNFTFQFFDLTRSTY